MSEDEKTPVHSASARLRLGLERCPACDGTGKTSLGETCFYCEGGKCVTVEKADQWRDAHPPDTDPETAHG